MDAWRKRVVNAKKKGIISKAKRPKKEKLNIKEPKPPRKPKGKTIKKLLPDDTAVAVIELFCRNLKTERDEGVS